MKYYYCQSKWEHAVIEAHNSADAKEKFTSIVNAWLEDYAKLTVKDIDACVVNVYFSEERGLTKHAPDVANAEAQKGVLHKNRSGKRAGVA